MRYLRLGLATLLVLVALRALFGHQDLIAALVAGGLAFWAWPTTKR